MCECLMDSRVNYGLLESGNDGHEILHILAIFRPYQRR